MFRSLAEVACVAVAICIFEHSFARTLAFHIVTLIDVTILELVDSLSVLDVVTPVAYVDVTISIVVCSFA